MSPRRRRAVTLLDFDLDALGITVCSVAGTNFTPHVKLLRALAVPFALITDFDRTQQGDSLGADRVVALMEHLLPEAEYESASVEALLQLAPRYGIFLNDSTFEIDLLRSGRITSIEPPPS